MDLLILTKKFGNKRIVRNIYEYWKGSKRTWLTKYRQSISGGHCLKSEQERGVHTFELAQAAQARSSGCRGLSYNRSYLTSWTLYSLLYLGRNTQQKIYVNNKKTRQNLWNRTVWPAKKKVV